MADMKMHYPWRVVAFVDILGFKAALDRSAEDEAEYKRLLATLTELRDFFLHPKDAHEIEVDRKLNADTQIIQASDSLVISRKVEERGGVFYMLSDLSFAIHILIEQGFLCRGAIAIGQMHHTGSIMFGPAYVEAYQAEAAQSLPVITFTKDLFRVAHRFHGQTDPGGGEWEVRYLRKWCKKLPDGRFYLDHFNDYQSLLGVSPQKTTSHYQKLRTILEADLKLTQVRGAFVKVLWAALEFNKVASGYGLPLLAVPDPATALTVEERAKVGL